jgi:hypothetical protein
MEREIERIIESAPDRASAERAIKELKEGHKMRMEEMERKAKELKERQRLEMIELEKQKAAEREEEQIRRIEESKRLQEIKKARAQQLVS